MACIGLCSADLLEKYLCFVLGTCLGWGLRTSSTSFQPYLSVKLTASRDNYRGECKLEFGIQGASLRRIAPGVSFGL